MISWQGVRLLACLAAMIAMLGLGGWARVRWGVADDPYGTTTTSGRYDDPFGSSSWIHHSRRSANIMEVMSAHFYEEPAPPPDPTAGYVVGEIGNLLSWLTNGDDEAAPARQPP